MKLRGSDRNMRLLRFRATPLKVCIFITLPMIAHRSVSAIGFMVFISHSYWHVISLCGISLRDPKLRAGYTSFAY